MLGGDENLARRRRARAAANLPTDRGGVIRRFPCAVGGLPTLAVVAAERRRRSRRADAFDGGGAWIDYRGGPAARSRPYSFSDLFAGRVDPRSSAGASWWSARRRRRCRTCTPTPTSATG